MRHPDCFVLRSCLICKKSFRRYKFLLKVRPLLYCSRKCYYEAVQRGFAYIPPVDGKNNPMYGKKHRLSSLKLIGKKSKKRTQGKDNPNYKNALKTLKCKICKKWVFRFQSQIFKDRFIVCSKKCLRKLMKLKYSGKNSQQYQGGKIRLNCEICGCFFYRAISQVKRTASHVCSKKCYGKLRQKTQLGKNNSNWRNGKSFEPYANIWRESLREEVRKRFDYKCMLCGVSQLECEIKLSVHHINYDKKNCSFSNLIPLCTSCNSKVNYNRKKHERYFKEVMHNVLFQK